MRSLWSRTGGALAALYALTFIGLYFVYVRRAGAWFADLPLALAALPFTIVMRALHGGAYDFGGEMTGTVIVAGLFCSMLAYIVGVILETAVRAVVRLARGVP